VLHPDGTASDEQGRSIKPADLQYSYSLVGSRARGAPVLGLYLAEGGGSYLYDPMRHDDALRLPGVGPDDLSATVSNAARQLGGQEID
jgi:hypothetical protein